MTHFLLVHSPLVGPSTWSPVRDELVLHGHEVTVPSLVDAALSGAWQPCVDAVLAAVDSAAPPAIVVGHSGAGLLLPHVASRLRPSPARLVFVDAGVPPGNGAVPALPRTLLEQVRARARSGRAPKWSEWWGPHAMTTLIPDSELRRTVVEEIPALPVSYFEQRVPVPDGWRRADGGYVLLSEAYREDARAAEALGWPVIDLAGGHLDIVTRPVTVTSALLDVVG